MDHLHLMESRLKDLLKQVRESPVKVNGVYAAKAPRAPRDTVPVEEFSSSAEQMEMVRQWAWLLKRVKAKEIEVCQIGREFIEIFCKWQGTPIRLRLPPPPKPEVENRQPPPPGIPAK